MQVHIDTEDELERERIIQRLMFSLNARREEIDQVRLRLTPIADVRGARLYRCQLHTRLRDGQVIDVDETQASADLAVTRTLERCVRTAQRRLLRPRQRRMM